MGRHSVPDEPEVEAAEGALGVLDLAARYGRHSRGDEEVDDTHTQRIAVIPDAPIEDRHDTDVITPVAAPPLEHTQPAPGPAAPVVDKPDKKALKAAAKARKADEKVRADAAKTQLRDDKGATKAARKAQRRESGTRADLRMLRENGAVRAQALAAVIVSFLLYTVVMVVIGASDVYLQWLWIPIVASGVLVGLVLDLAHRRAVKPPTS